MKMIKRGLRNIMKDPSIFFIKKKQTIKLHFDMHHGHKNLDKAINLLDQEDREDHPPLNSTLERLRLLLTRE